jgi:hypothetical protein
VAGGVFRNPNVPAINQPLADVVALVSVVGHLREGMESLGGMRGGALDRAATLHDLVLLGLVTEAQVRAILRGP